MTEVFTLDVPKIEKVAGRKETVMKGYTTQDEKEEKRAGCSDPEIVSH